MCCSIPVPPCRALPLQLGGWPQPRAVSPLLCTACAVHYCAANGAGSTDTSLWTHYKAGERRYCGNDFPDGMRKNDRLAQASEPRAHRVGGRVESAVVGAGNTAAASLSDRGTACLPACRTSSRPPPRRSPTTSPSAPQRLSARA